MKITKLAEKTSRETSYTREKPVASSLLFKWWLSSWPEWVSLILLLITLGLAVASIQRAQWITPQPSLITILIFAFLTALVLVKSRLPTAASLPLSVTLGAVVTLWQVSKLMPPLAITSEGNRLLLALQFLWQTMRLDKPSETTLYFALFLIVFTWVLGYASTWLLLRMKNAWGAVFLSTMAILVNLRYLTEDHYLFFTFYLLAAMLLLAQTNLAGHRHRLEQKGAHHYPNQGALYLMLLVMVLSALVVTGIWSVPKIRLNQVRFPIITNIHWLENFSDSWLNFFARVQVKQPTLANTEQEILSFRDSAVRKNEVLFAVTSSKPPSYWWQRRYDRYHSGGWTSESAAAHTLRSNVPITPPELLPKGGKLTYTVINKLRTDVLLTAGEFLSSDIPVVAHTAGANFEPADIVAITAPLMLNYGEGYTITTHVPSPTSAELSQAGEHYPRYITERYLQLPPELPQRIKQLSRIATARAPTSYDKVVALINLLSVLPYVEGGTPPPEEADGVNHFLFVRRGGNSTDFTSALVVMLRSVGVPSRLSAGYRFGEWDESSKTVTIRASHFHVRAEVYFSGYGWIEFEATPRDSENIGVYDADNPMAGDSNVDDDMLTDGSRQAVNGSTTPDDDSVTGGGGSAFGDIVEEYQFVDTPLAVSLGQPFIKISLALLVLVFFLLTVRLVVKWWRRYHRLDYASRVYAGMCFFASLNGLRPEPQQTTLEYCAQLSDVFPYQTEAIGTIANVYLRSQFSQKKALRLEDKEKLRQAWRVILPTFLKRLSQKK